MSLRAIKLDAYVIACDVCGAKSKSAGLMPVEAERLAAVHGWLAQANPLKHTCPTCAPVLTATPAAGR